MLEELQGLPEQLPLYQQQVQRFFDLVLDVDKAGRDPQQQASAHYLYDAPKDPSLFSFRCQRRTVKNLKRRPENDPNAGNIALVIYAGTLSAGQLSAGSSGGGTGWTPAFHRSLSR